MVTILAFPPPRRKYLLNLIVVQWPRSNRDITANARTHGRTYTAWSPLDIFQMSYDFLFFVGHNARETQKVFRGHRAIYSKTREVTTHCQCLLQEFFKWGHIVPLPPQKGDISFKPEVCIRILARLCAVVKVRLASVK